jgi:SPP1 gp7 family putative phage head morphogenesis protein
MAEVAAVRPKFERSRNLMEDVYFGTAEETFQESGYYPDSTVKPYNPDDLYQKTGNYDIFEDMAKDDQVSVCMRLKTDLVVGTGFDIFCSNPEHELIKDDLELALNEDMDVPFEDCLEEILTAYIYGFSLTEKIFGYRPDGSLTLKMLKTRHPATWLIHTDEKGNVEKYQQLGTRKDKEIEPKSLIHFVANRKFQNPYGTSDLRSAYTAWFAKRQIVRYYAIFLEKAASPTPVARYDKNAPPEAVTDIFNAIKSFQTKTALVMPKDIEVEFLESKSSGEAYDKAIAIFNMFIGRSLFVPDLLGLHGAQTGGGSYSLGTEQIALFMKHIGRRRRALESMINREIIWPLVFHNFGYVDDYPKFKLRPISDADAMEAAKLWVEAAKSRIYKPTSDEVNYFRTLVKFPEGEVEEYGPDAQVAQVQANQGAARVEIEDAEEKETEIEEIEPREDAENLEGKAEDNRPEQKTFKLGAYPPGDYHRKVDFKAIEKQMSAFDEALIRDLKPIVTLAIEDVYDQINDKKVIQKQDPAKLETVKVKKLKDIRTLMRRSLRDIWVEGESSAKSELFKGQFAKSTVLPDEKFLEILDQELFDFIGDWEYKVTQRARQAAIAAIKDGQSISSFVTANVEGSIGEAMVSLERYSRTKHTEVMNKGRLSFFEKSGVVTGYQYSAIMDSKTSEICSALDGKFFEAGSQPIPPMHFNCRSLLIPITKYESFTPTKSIGGQSPEDFLTDNVGKGFPVK